MEKNKIINTLKTSLSYSDLILHAKECEGSYIKVMDLDFTSSFFSTNRKFRFSYTWENALLIVENCTFFINSEDLLTSCHFKGALNFHISSYSLKEANKDFTFFNFTEVDEEDFTNSEFAKLELSQNDYFLTLEISNWSYEDLVISATFFYLEHIHAQCLEKKLFLATSDKLQQKMGILNKSFLGLEAVSACISLLLFSKIFEKKLFLTLKKQIFFWYILTFGFMGFLYL